MNTPARLRPTAWGEWAACSSFARRSLTRRGSRGRDAVQMARNEMWTWSKCSLEQLDEGSRQACQAGWSRGAEGRRNAAVRPGRGEGRNGLVGSVQLSLVGFGGEAGPCGPVGPVGGNAVGCGGGAGELVGAAVGDFGVIAVIELPWSAVH